MKNKSKLCSIQIRDVNLQYESYYIIIQPENGQSFKTPETSLTIVKLHDNASFFYISSLGLK